MDCPEVWARIAVLNGQSQAAEALYLEQNQVEKAIQMYLSLHKWENGNTLNDIMLRNIFCRNICTTLSYNNYVIIVKLTQ